MRIELINEMISDAEKYLKSEDPYQRAAANANLGAAYTYLMQHYDDLTVKKAMQMTGDYYKVLAARIRVQHGIPTLYPMHEVGLLGLEVLECKTCGRGMSISGRDACEDCPRILHGPTPVNAEEAAKYGPGTLVDPANLVPPVDSRED
ncbi:hypothetical protein [Actinokineospora enzanensis]|uniref:hypothetical protein n=1 Tax=Actinokineospora enzanensis TaxID=155975 RepID=UPI00037B5B82|nr:hypothetical protein [Actinokineospora enzanensis]